MKRALLLLLPLGAACLVREPLPEPPPPTAAHETRRTEFPDGGVRSERTLLVWSDGRLERDGAEREFHPDGSLAEERFFARDRPVGVWRSLYPGGTPRSEVDLGTDADAPTVQRFWHANGVLAAEGTLRHGKREGRWRYYDAEGRVEREGGYRDGRRDGPWTFRRPDGTVEAEGWYSLGARVGEWRLLDEDGGTHLRRADAGPAAGAADP